MTIEKKDHSAISLQIVLIRAFIASLPWTGPFLIALLIIWILLKKI